MKTLLSTLLMLVSCFAMAIDYLAETDLPARVQIIETGKTKVVSILNSKVAFRNVTVKPATKYALTMEASFHGDAESMEENPRFAFFNQPGRTSPRLPSREIQFLDAAGKRTGQSIVCAMPFRKSRLYHDAFYTPRTAAAVRITIASGNHLRLRLTQLKLEATPDAGTLNVNHSFSSHYSGWQNIAAGGQLIEHDGKRILDTKYGSTGRMIPLPGPGTYGLSAKATGNGYNSVVIVRIHDEQGKELMRVPTRNYGPVKYFVPPKEAATASFLVYSCLLEEVRLSRIGDEDMINALRKK